MSFVTRKDLPRYNKNNSINYRTNNLWGYLFIFIHVLFETLHLACPFTILQNDNITKGLEGKDKSFRNFECFLESFFPKTTQLLG